MYAFAVVALRLMAISLFIACLTILFTGLGTTFASRGEYSLEPMNWDFFISTAGMAAGYLLGAILLFMLAPPLARRIAPKEPAASLPGISSLARLGTFLVGLLTLAEGAVTVARAAVVLASTELGDWVAVWQGLAHMAVGLAVILLAPHMDRLAPKAAPQPGA